MSFSKPKTAAPVVTKTPTVDTARENQDAVDELLRRRGLKSTMATGALGASTGQIKSSASALLGG